MKIEMIHNRIDTNILSLLQNMSIEECIQNLQTIKHKLQFQTEKTYSNIDEVLKINSARERYTWMYILHTDKRITLLKKLKLKKDFKKVLYKEKLMTVKHIPIVHSLKYKIIAMSES